MIAYMEIKSMDEFMALKPETVTAPIDWETLFGQAGHGWGGMLSDAERRARVQREQFGMDPKWGIAKSQDERTAAYAAVCYMATPDAMRVPVVQVAISERCGSWHAAAKVAGRLSSCPCHSCQEARKA